MFFFIAQIKILTFEGRIGWTNWWPEAYVYDISTTRYNRIIFRFQEHVSRNLENNKAAINPSILSRRWFKPPNKNIIKDTGNNLSRGWGDYVMLPRARLCTNPRRSREEHVNGPWWLEFGTGVSLHTSPLLQVLSKTSKASGENYGFFSIFHNNNNIYYRSI